MTDKMIKEFAHDRDTALAEMSLPKFKRFLKKWFPNIPIPDDEVLECSMRKMALECTNLTFEVKERACLWLMEHNYRTDMLGDPIEQRYIRMKEEVLQ